MAASKKAMKREESHTKKNEQKIANFLIKFLQTKKGGGVLLAVSRALAANISANVVLHCLILDFEDLLDELEDDEFDGDEFSKLKEGLNSLKALKNGYSEHTENMALSRIDLRNSVPVDVKIKLYVWSNNLIEAVLLYPHNSLEVFQKENAQISFKYLLSVIIYEYFKRNNICIEDQSSLDPMIDNIFMNLLKKLTDHIDSTKYLDGGIN